MFRIFHTDIVNKYCRKLIFEWISHLYVHCVESGTKVQRKLMTWLLVESSGCYKSSTNQTILVRSTSDHQILFAGCYISFDPAFSRS